MLNQAIGFLNLMVGSIFAFGTYLAFHDKRINTITFFVLPLVHFFAGFGLFKLKAWSRYLTLSLACFYFISGIFALQSVSSVVDYVPIAQLIRYVPFGLLRLASPSVVIFVFLMVLPAVTVALLTPKPIAVRFESWLGGRFSWSAPLPVVVASGIIFTYALLMHSDLASFLSPSGRNVLGFEFNSLQSQILHYVEFSLPFFLALGFVSSGRLVFYGTLAFALYYWLPFLLSDTKPAFLKDFKFVFFGAGWALTALSLLIYRSFFLGHGVWLEKRGTSKLKEETAPIGDTLKPVEEKVKPRFVFVLDRRWVYLILAIAFVSFISGSMVYLWSSGRLSFSKGKRKQSVSLGPPNFRFEGASIDRHGTFAVIQGNVVQVGQTVQGYQVEAIESDRVLLSKEGKHYSLDEKGNLKGMV
ncbi:MAG: hypothetical protein HYS55_06075 [Candidatus Omnitrophica bacterium]|nr:hypothetical protein [Candidatus Omnitrophota bacterium]